MMETKYRFYCFHCGWNAKIEKWERPIGTYWLCKCCGLHGFMSDPDAPKFLPENEQGEKEADYDFSVRIFGFG